MGEVDRYQGSLVGLALGDAIGAPVEKCSYEKTRNYLDNSVVPQDFDASDLKSSFDDLPFGHVTDDTQFTVELVRSLVEHEGQFVGKDYALRIVKLFEEDRIVGYGQTTKQSVDRLVEGVKWNQAGDTNSTSNGSAMRAVPIGLVEKDPVSVVAYSFMQSIITHRNDEAIAGSIAISLATYQMLHRGEIDFDELASWVDSWDKVFEGNILSLKNRIEEDSQDEILRWVESLQDNTNWDGISPYSKSSVLWALYSVATNSDSYWGVIETAIYGVGDVDTIACMAGGISGAKNGLNAIPEALRSKIKDIKGPCFDKLKKLGTQLYRSKNF